MPPYIEKLKICNFLSFFGSYEVELRPFTAIVCNYFEGKEDLFRAIEFVFGASLHEIRVPFPKHAVHRAFWEALDNGTYIKCFVEITVKVGHDKTVTYHRGVNNGNIDSKIDDKIVNSKEYEGSLKNLNLNIRHKNLIMYKHFFSNIIWGSSEELEMILTAILRENSEVEEWRKASSRVKHLKELQRIISQKHLLQMKKSHRTIEKFVNHFNVLTTKRDSVLDDMLQEDMQEEYSAPSVQTTTEYNETSFEEKLQDIRILEERRDLLLEKYNTLVIRGNVLLCEFHCIEIKIAWKSRKPNIVQERIKKLKLKLANAESRLSSIWKNLTDNEDHVQELSRKISMNLASLWDGWQSYNLQNRFTTYGRLIDYLQPNRFIKLLRKILGESVLFGNLCDKRETALLCLKHLKRSRYEGRETFIVLEEYSTKLKDLLIASGEEGIIINNPQELQLFLCKLKEYELIATVPVIIRRRFNFTLEEGKNHKDDVIYPEDGVFVNSDGIISCVNEDYVQFETEGSIVDNINKLLIEQEMKFQQRCDLFFMRWETLEHICKVEDDISYIRKNYERTKRSSCTEFDEVSKIERLSEDSEKNLSAEETSLEEISQELMFVEEEKMEAERELTNITAALRSFYAVSNKLWFPPTKKLIFSQYPKRRYICYEKELKELRTIMTRDDIEDFEGWKDWRRETINSLIRDLGDVRNLLEDSKKVLNNLTALRKKILSPFLEHCSVYLTTTFNLIIDTALPFLTLSMSPAGDKLQLLSSLPEASVNIIEIKHFNTFLKCIAALALFLEIAAYDNIPLIILDDIQEFLPGHNETFEALLTEYTLQRIVATDEHVGFQILMRIGQFLNFYSKKNSSRKKVREYGKSDVTGPMQIIYVTSKDLVHAARYYVWIRSNVLPDEFITENHDSYSMLEEIHID